MAAFVPAHATIVVATYANCLEDGTMVDRSWTTQSPYLAEWSFALTQTNYTQDGLRTLTGSQIAPGRVRAEFRFAPSYRVSQVVANHWGFDGYAYYGVTTSATTCTSPGVQFFEEPRRAPSSALASNVSSGIGQIAPALDLPASQPTPAATQRGVRIDSVANVLPPDHFERSKQEWEHFAAQATATGVAQLLEQASSAPTKRAAGQANASSHRLTFAAAHVGSTPLGNVSPSLNLPTGSNLAAGWTGSTRIFRIAPSSWVMLEEMDLDAIQANVVILREAINSEVNGSPALLRSTTDAHGPSLTALTWIANGKRYSLKTNLPAAQASERLLSIARGLY